MSNPQSSLYLPVASSYLKSSTAILPAVSATVGASMSAYVYTSSPSTDNSIDIYYNGHYPSFVLGSSTTITLAYNGSSYNITNAGSGLPTIQPNTWYFAAVVLTASGTLYLYWGLAGAVPTRYTAHTGLSGTQFNRLCSNI